MNNLKQLPVWINWKYEERSGNLTKIPKNPKTGGNAQSNNPQTWCSFAKAEAESHKYSGIGFVFANGICGVDIDGSDGHTKENPLSAELLDLFKGTYTERSPSGSGYHIIFKCDMSQIPTVYKDGKPTLNPLYTYKNSENGIECYMSGLFLFEINQL